MNEGCKTINTSIFLVQVCCWSFDSIILSSRLDPSRPYPVVQASSWPASSRGLALQSRRGNGQCFTSCRGRMVGLVNPFVWPRFFLSRSLSLSSSFSLARSLSLSLCSFSSPPPPSRSVGLVVCRGRWNYKVEGSGSDNKDLTTAGRKDETHRHPRRLPIGRARFLR